MHRPVRSFVRRAGRVTLAQREALDTLLPSYVLDTKQAFCAGSVFERQAPCWLEIGFGNGQALLQLAAQHPEVDFIGVEVHDPGVGRLLIGLQEHALTNVRVHHGDASELLRDVISPASLDRIMVFFPDPWPKKRHHKRRLLQPEMVTLLASRLREAGVLHTATDWEAYASHMLEVLQGEVGLQNLSSAGGFAPDCDVRPETHFERRGRRLGHGVWDLLFARKQTEL
jgi:tRNA (guanine-N7-)-methyltransferase